MKTTACLLSLTLVFGTVVQPVNAAMIGTGDMLAGTTDTSTVTADVDELRGRVAQALVAHGVSRTDAVERAAMLTQNELRLIQQEIDQLPAGQSALGVIGAVFLVLVILEVVGVIDIFKKL